MAGVYGIFASGGYKTPPYAFTQIIGSNGDILYDRKRDAPPRERVLDDKIVAEMNGMLVQVPEKGTGRAAKLDGIRTAGKTGTTSGFRDAWFDGFTGNYVGIIWYGNDNFIPTARMTGGTLPAMTWHRFMQFAHTGIELKPIPFVEPERPASAAVAKAEEAKISDGAAVPDSPATPAAEPASPRPVSLSLASTQRLMAIEELMRTARPLKPVQMTENR